MSQMLKISILIPTYNYGNYIRRAIDSVLAQTYQNWEIVIIDDGSTDETENILLQINDNRIRYYRNKVNIGVTRAINKGLGLIKGDAVCVLAADDSLPVNSLELRIVELNKPNCDFVIGGLTVIEAEAKKYIPPVKITSLDEVGKFLQTHPNNVGINNATLMFKNRVIEKLGKRLNDSTIGNHADYEFALRMIARQHGSIINKSLYNYFKHKNSLSSMIGDLDNGIRLKKLESRYLKIINKKLLEIN